PLKKPLLGLFVAIGAAATAAMFFISRGEWLFALTLFVVGNVGVAASIVFYEAMLPHIAAPAELDRVSTAGYAMGYVGGGVLLALNVVMMAQPGWFGLSGKDQAVRASLASVAVWWVVFSIPLFRHVPEPPVRAGGPEGGGVAAAVRGLWHTLAEL